MQYPHYTMDSLCRLFGNTRQAYYERDRYLSRQHLEEDMILFLVREARTDFPRMGSRKLLVYLEKRFQQAGIEIGRDAFIDLLGHNMLLVKRRRSQHRTTFSNHWMRKYPNLIRNFTPTAPNQLWVSDITYIETEGRFLYLSLITDAYSRKIVGWALAPTLEARYTIYALEKAVRTLPQGHQGLIHHSDLGVQYCCGDYVKVLTANHIHISMTESGDPLENAIAERVNGILKTEWLNNLPKKSPKEMLVYIEKIITLYNEQRPHQSISYQTPSSVHASGISVERKWKSYYPVKEKALAKEKIENSTNFTFLSPVMCQAISGQTIPVLETVKPF